MPSSPLLGLLNTFSIFGLRPPVQLHHPLIPNPIAQSLPVQPRSLSLQAAAKRFAACSGHADVDLRCFCSASKEFVQLIEAFGPWTETSLKDARRNLITIEEAVKEYGLSSMESLLQREAARGPSSSGPAPSSLAEAVMWARIQLKFWVEVFDQHVNKPSSLPDELIRGFDESMATYFFAGVRLAFSFAARKVPDWDQLPCARSLATSKEALTDELRNFVARVKPLIQRMHTIQSSLGCEDPRTPQRAYR